MCQSLCAGKHGTTLEHGRSYTGPIILFRRHINSIVYLNAPGARSLSTKQVRDAAGRTPILLAKSRQFLTVALGSRFNGGFHEDESVQCKGALTLFSCNVDMHYLINGAIRTKTMPLVPMAKEVPQSNGRSVAYRIFGSNLLVRRSNDRRAREQNNKNEKHSTTSI